MTDRLSVEPFRQEIDTAAHSTLTQWQGVFVDVGVTKEQATEEFKLLVAEAVEFFQRKLKEKLALREQLEKEVAELVKAVESSLHELGDPHAETEKFKQIRALPLHLQSVQLRKFAQDLTKVKEQRIASLQVLHEKLHSLYSALGVDPNPNFLTIGNPTIGRVREYEEQISLLEKELDKIKNNIDKYRLEIVEMWKILDGKDTKHDSDIDIFILDPSKSNLKISRSTFQQLEELHTKLTLEKDKRTTLKTKYLDGIKLLYESLQIPTDDVKRVAFEKQDVSGISPEVMSVLKEEHDRLYAFKKERFQALIAKAKARLEHLWTELQFSNDQKEQFYKTTKTNDEYGDQYNDEAVLELMTLEIAKLERLLALIGPLLKMIVRREWIKSEMHKFEKSASDKNRLFGSSLKLLEEEKFRKIVAKEFPKLTDELRTKIAEFERQNPGERVLYQGFPYLETMNQEKENPNFKLMHLRLLTKDNSSGSDASEISEADITVSSKHEGVSSPSLSRPSSTREVSSPSLSRPASARTRAASKPSTPTMSRPSTATPKSSAKKKPP